MARHEVELGPPGTEVGEGRPAAGKKRWLPSHHQPRDQVGDSPAVTLCQSPAETLPRDISKRS